MSTERTTTMSWLKPDFANSLAAVKCISTIFLEVLIWYLERPIFSVSKPVLQHNTIIFYAPGYFEKMPFHLILHA